VGTDDRNPGEILVRQGAALVRRVALEFWGTDAPVYPELRGELRWVCAPRFSPLRRRSAELEGAPPLVSKVGLLRPDSTASPLSIPTEAQS